MHSCATRRFTADRVRRGTPGMKRSLRNYGRLSASPRVSNSRNGFFLVRMQLKIESVINLSLSLPRSGPLDITSARDFWPRGALKRKRLRAGRLADHCGHRSNSRGKLELSFRRKTRREPSVPFYFYSFLFKFSCGQT